MKTVDVELVRPSILLCETWPAPIRRGDLRVDLTPREFVDFSRRLGIAEAIKRDMRRQYADAARRFPRNEPWADAWDRSVNFWGVYDEVGQVLVPEDPCYSGTRSGVALVASTDWWTLTGPAAGQLRILESFIGGEAAASTTTRTHLNISTGGSTPTEGTEVKLNSRSPSSASSYRTGWTTQPTAGSAIILHSFNAFGGADRHVPQPGAEIYAVNGEQVSNRQEAGTPTCSGHVVWEEL